MKELAKPQGAENFSANRQVTDVNQSTPDVKNPGKWKKARLALTLSASLFAAACAHENNIPVASEEGVGTVDFNKRSFTATMNTEKQKQDFRKIFLCPEGAKPLLIGPQISTDTADAAKNNYKCVRTGGAEAQQIPLPSSPAVQAEPGLARPVTRTIEEVTERGKKGREVITKTVTEYSPPAPPIVVQQPPKPDVYDMSEVSLVSEKTWALMLKHTIPAIGSAALNATGFAFGMGALRPSINNTTIKQEGANATGGSGSSTNSLDTHVGVTATGGSNDTKVGVTANPTAVNKNENEATAVAKQNQGQGQHQNEWQKQIQINK